MSVYNGVDGTLLNVKQDFLDDDGSPIVPKAGYPLVKLLTLDKATISSTICSPSATPGTWTASLSVPNMKLEQKKEFLLLWLCITPGGSKFRVTDSVVLEPKVETRESDVVTTFGDLSFSFVLPMVYGPTWTGTYQIYQNNEALVDTSANSLDDPAVTVEPGVDRTVVTCPLAVPAPSLYSYVLKIDLKPAGGRPRSFIYKLWAATPQILLAMSALDSFLNKSRVENVIPELRYNDGDLMHYLERGLYLFNTVSQVTTFNGLNMQGVLYDAWINCSCYYALGAQLLAEGSLSFDFSGQGVSLNVDRTPQLESALGRIESYINEKLAPLKKQLYKNGTTSGDGAVGRTGINNPSNVGVLTMMNAPTTRLPRFTKMFVGRRS